MELIKISAKDDAVLLRSGDGRKGWFTFLDMLSYGGREYAALADEADELCVMEFFEGDGETPERYREIADDATFSAVAERFARQSPPLFEH